MPDEAAPDPAIELRDLDIGYQSRVVVRIPSIDIARGRITCVLGPSGCGKSTLLRTILGLERPIAGTIRVDGVVTSSDDGDALTAFRARSGVLFQGAALFGSLTLEENVAFPMLERGGISRALALRVARHRLATVGLREAAQALPSAVSGGMRKRAGIARALANDPDYLFLDEPSAGLDPISAAGIDDLVREVRERSHATIVVITHELASLHLIADDLIMLAGGTVRAHGSLLAVSNSDDPMIRAFFDRRSAPDAGRATPFLARMDRDPRRS